MVLTHLQTRTSSTTKKKVFERTLLLNEDESVIEDLYGEEVYVSSFDNLGNEVFIKPGKDYKMDSIKTIEVDICQKFDFNGTCICYAKKRISID